MKISIDTDTDTFESAFTAIHAAYGVPLAEVAMLLDEIDYSEDDENGEDGEDGEDDASPPDDYLPGNWNRKRIRKLLSYVKDDAAEALAFIAQNAPSVDLEDVFQHMAEYTGIENFNGQQMGGRMSSIGHAVKRIPGISADIVATDYTYRKYRMDKGIAKVLLEEFED